MDTRSPQRRTRDVLSKKWVAWVDIGVGLVIVAGVLVVAFQGVTPPGNEAASSRVSTRHSTPVLGIDLSGPRDPEHPYPESWALSGVREAAERADFQLVVPDTTFANPSSMTGVYLLPGNSISMTYPSPAEPRAYLRQPFVEVYESSWNPDRDPQKAYAELVINDENPYESLTTLDGQTALVVAPHSPADDEKANAAFVRVVSNDVEFQISGGEDLKLLEEIASSLVSDSGAVGGE
jgi:hypothetical protein